MTGAEQARALIDRFTSGTATLGGKSMDVVLVDDPPGYLRPATPLEVECRALARHALALADALRAIAEGGLGDEPWFANYDRIREFAREARRRFEEEA